MGKPLELSWIPKGAEIFLLEQKNLMYPKGVHDTPLKKKAVIPYNKPSIMSSPAVIAYTKLFAGNLYDIGNPPEPGYWESPWNSDRFLKV